MVQKALELDICDPSTGSTLGQLQLSVSNKGSFTLFSKADDCETATALFTQTQKSWKTAGIDDDLTTNEPESRAKTPKKKKVLSKPIEQIDPNVISEKLTQLKGTQEMDRKRLRVERVKASRVNKEY